MTEGREDKSKGPNDAHNIGQDGNKRLPKAHLSDLENFDSCL